MRQSILPRSRQRVSFALASTLALVVLGGSAARGQCVIDYTADLDSPVGYTAGSGNAVVHGTFNCGELVTGELCGSGTYEGSCLSSTNDAWVVSCQGSCDAVIGDTSDSVTCDGVEVFRGHATGQCAGAVCESDATGTDGPTGNTTHAIAVVDPTSLPASFQDCGFGGAGVSHVHYVGVTTIPLPAR